MSQILRLLFLLYLLAIAGSPLGLARADEATPTQPPGTEEFTALVAEAKMSYRQPDGYQATPVRANALFPYEHADRNPEGTLEIRYAIRPLGRIRIEYDDPHSSAPDPDHVFPLMFQSLTTLLSGGSYSPSREYPSEEARERFHAHWAAAAVFDISPGFPTAHKQALMLAMHRNKEADAYVIFLFDDYAAVKHEIDAHLNALAFLP